MNNPRVTGQKAPPNAGSGESEKGRVMTRSGSKRKNDGVSAVDNGKAPRQNAAREPPAKRPKSNKTAVKESSAPAMIDSNKKSRSALAPRSSKVMVKTAPPKLRKRGQAPAMSESESESESEEEITQLQPPKTLQPGHRQSSVKESQEESDQGDNEDVEMLEDERNQDLDASSLYKDEAPIFTTMKRSGHDGKKKGPMTFYPDDDRNNDQDDERNSSDLGLQDEVSIPPTSDGEGFTSGPGGDDLAVVSDNDDSENEPVVTAKQSKVKGKKAQKLAQELPVISTVAKSTSTALPQPVPAAPSAPIPWKPHTNIILKPHSSNARTFKIALTGQSREIKNTIDKAWRLGSLLLVSNTQYCGLDIEGLHSLSLAALIQCAEELGYGDGFDIAHRLEDGDAEKYIQPLYSYVAHRISLERAKLKAGFAATVLTALNIDNSPEGIERAKTLLREADYIYSEKADGKFDYQKPFANPVVHKYLGAVFFSNTKYSKRISAKKSDIFISSIPEKPLELEIPKAMAAVAGCVIYAILKDHADSKEQDFPPVNMKMQWKAFLQTLDQAENTNKQRYHKLMHQLYLNSSHTIAPTNDGLSAVDIVKKIDWSAFAESESESEPTAMGSGVNASAMPEPRAQGAV
ncbi:hypothetical protein VKT23_012642 [Stygiomarasmius scandens]|uniref:DUF6532 domain-containing protein n=1 Tax=Marasmiellus scandens TaxID=2682957 RepID=A0ABR1J8D8_9AGAR